MSSELVKMARALLRARRPLLGAAAPQLAVLTTYWVVGAIYTFPLVARLFSAFPGGMDTFGFLWNNWWIYHAVVHLHTKPYFTDYVFAPAQLDLRFHTFGLLYGLLSIPFMPLLGSTGVLNSQSLLTTTLNGYAAFRLTDYVAKDAWVAYVCGLAIAGVPAVNFHLDVGRVSCSALWPAIFALYFGLRVLAEPSAWGGLLWGASVAASLLADQQIAIFCAGWLLVLGVDSIVRRPRDLLSGRFLRSAAIAVIVAGPFAYLLCIRPLAHGAGYTVPGAIEAQNYSVPLWAFAPVWVWRAYGSVLPVGLIAGLAMLRRMSSLWPWVLGSIAFLVLTTGPVLQVGTHGLPMPFAWLRKLPGLSQFRTPYRFQMPAALGLAVTFAIVLSTALGRVQFRVRRAVLAGCALVVAGDLVARRIVTGFSTQSMAREPLYEQIRSDPTDCLVLEIPLGVRTGTDRIGPGELFSYYQPIHRKRMINAMIARVPVDALRYYRESHSLMFLTGEEPPDGDIATDLRRRLEELDVGYVVVHPAMLEPIRLRQILGLLTAVDGLVPMPSDDGVLAFRRTSTAAERHRRD
ncbi:MAG TPA: hypothetical protein VEK07_03260 [Polyangiaceae bacterium]|nr:hypothetical protein [Polyangiaceae bacterium]